MLTGNLVRVRVTRDRVIPQYIRRDDPDWLEVAESLLLIFREGAGRTRGELQEEIDELIGTGGVATLVHQGLAKVLEDRSEFEVVADVPPEQLREKVFTAAAEARRKSVGSGATRPFRAEDVLEGVGQELGLPAEQVAASLFADLKDENRLLGFGDLSAQRLLDRYNVALAQAVMLKSVLVKAEVRREKPARYRQLFRHLKFHRLMYRVQGSMDEGYTFQIDGPLSLFSATNRYGVQIANFLPALLLCHEFRVEAELRWGPKREPKFFLLDGGEGLVSHYADTGTYTPPELGAFVERFKQVAPDWDVSESTDLIELGREGVWVPDYRFVHRRTGTDVFVEVVGFWKRGTLDRLLRLLPEHGPPRVILAVSEKLKVDEATLGEMKGPILWFKDLPNATELAGRLRTFLPSPGRLELGA